MLYCQPVSFYKELKYISEHNPFFLKKISLANFNIDSNLGCIEPINYIIKMVLSEDNFYGNDDIIALRTYGTNNSLVPTHKFMSVYYAIIFNGSLLISKPSTSYIAIENDEVLYVDTDEYGDVYQYTLDEIAHDNVDGYSIGSYIKYHERIFHNDNILAKIPTFLLNNLV